MSQHRTRRRIGLVAMGAAALAGAALLTLTTVSVLVNVATAGTRPPPPLGPASRYVRTGDVLTHYLQWGDAGTPVVLVHGFVESGWVWSTVGPLLAQGHRVYAPDVRGYGYTQRRGPYTLAADTDQLAAFIAALALDGAHGGRPLLVGHSLGAAIVGAVALHDPGAVVGVVFLDGDGTPNGGGPSWTRQLLTDPYLTSLIRVAVRSPWAIDAIYRYACGPTCPPLTAADRAQWTRPFQVPGAEEALKQIAHSPLIGLSDAELRAIAVPAGVVVGADSPLMSPELTRLTAERLRARWVVSVPAARHLVMVSHPVELAQIIGRIRAELP